MRPRSDPRQLVTVDDPCLQHRAGRAGGRQPAAAGRETRNPNHEFRIKSEIRRPGLALLGGLGGSQSRRACTERSERDAAPMPEVCG